LVDCAHAENFRFLVEEKDTWLRPSKTSGLHSETSHRNPTSIQVGKFLTYFLLGYITFYISQLLTTHEVKFSNIKKKEGGRGGKEEEKRRKLRTVR